jgi:flagellar hook-length control protein FliK
MPPATTDRLATATPDSSLIRLESLFQPQASPLSSDGRGIVADPRPTAAPDLITRQILPRIGMPGAVSVTLAPVELGTLQFEVTLKGDMLHLHLVVEQPATLDLLRRQGDQMIAELRQAGFGQASLSFASSDGQSGQNARGDDPPPQQARPAATLSTPLRAPDPAPRPTPTTGSLDLRL